MLNVKKIGTIIASLVLSTIALPAASLPESKLDVSEKYIVTLNKRLSPHAIESHLDWVSDTQKRSVGRRSDSGIVAIYNISDFHAYSGTFDSDVIQKLRRSPEVCCLVPPAHVSSIRVNPSEQAANLGAISSKQPGAASYHYDNSAGQGTYAYIVDSGINIVHDDFGRRAGQGYNGVGGAFEDTYGHGTHVAGVIGGETHGVAKLCNLIDVKVFVGRQSTTSAILNEFMWAADDIVTQSRQGRAIINLSFGGPSSTVWTNAINAAYEGGILSIVAPGNQGVPASTRSPANAQNVLTVGAIEEFDSTWSEAWYSNYGDAVHVLAPGSGVESTSIGSSSATEVRTGTSMAAPHVAGIALYLANLENITSPSVLKARILELAMTGQVGGLQTGSLNKVAYDGYLQIAPGAGL